MPVVPDGAGLLAAIVRSSDDAIISVDRDGNVLTWNRAAERIFGFTEAETVGKSIAVVAGPEFRDEQLQNLDRLMKGEHIEHFETVRITKDGRRIDVSMTLSPVRDFTGTIVAFSGITREITERKRAEQALLHRVKFEKFLFELSKTFIGLTEEEVEAEMERGLADVGQFLEMDRVSVLELSPDRSELTIAYSWSAPGVTSPPGRITKSAQPWWIDRVLRGEVSLTSYPDDLPEEAALEREYLRRREVASAASIPFKVSGEIAGAISYLTVHRHVSWTEERVNELRAIGDILWNALKRQRTMQALRAAQETAECARRESEVLRASEDRYRGLAEQVADGIIITDATGRPLDANGAACELWGYTLDELKTLTVDDMFAAEEIPRLREVQGRLARGEVLHSEWHFRRKDGSVFIGETVGRTLSDGRLQAVVRDITERKAAETALRESEQRLQSYLDQAGDAIYVLDGESGQILNANNGATEMLGYSRTELLQMSAADIEISHTPAAITESHRLTSQRRVDLDGVHRRKDGSTVPVEIRMTSLRPATPHQVLSIVRDITERKRVEQERAEEARRKDEFLALLGHELRNPLAAIYTAIQVLSQGAEAATRKRMEEIIGQQTTTMRRLVDDLLELERITHGHIALKPEALDLGDCLQRAVAAVQSTVASRRQELLLRVPSGSVRFMADATRLDQIVGNLLANASKYTDPGGRIELSGVKEGSDVVIRCKDNGRGILPEYQRKIFEPFVRQPITELGYGEASIGLGLALVKQLTELHGGTISVESGGPGLGSEFTVRLPLVAPPTSQTSAGESAIRSPRRARSIVIVEDNPDLRTALATALEQAGHSVHVFEDGPSALVGISGLEPDAVLIDIGLPGMDGYELAAQLEVQPNMTNARWIAVSGFKQRGKGHAVFDHYLTKPVDVTALLSLLDQD